MADRADDLRRATQRFFRRFGALSADATPCGKPLPMAHAHALMVLLASGELSQQQLGDALCIDKSNVARLCARMTEMGHTRQRASDRDARSRLVSLTSRGERLAAEVEAASHERFSALLGAVPAARRKDVVEAMQLLVVAIEATTARGALREVSA
jgi:DNA-binding MarR family transcriptional regulator